MVGQLPLATGLRHADVEENTPHRVRKACPKSVVAATAVTVGPSAFVRFNARPGRPVRSAVSSGRGDDGFPWKSEQFAAFVMLKCLAPVTRRQSRDRRASRAWELTVPACANVPFPTVRTIKASPRCGHAACSSRWTPTEVYSKEKDV
ncbi:hypothetical protein GCM10022384_59620 [Streptomyces marokkonensis]|uniref:Uncharacterized protein n=1 Tax=Streptomyces marokkonensis TaxID=324855 RepID=A0ABP7S1R8_9ACTN